MHAFIIDEVLSVPEQEEQHGLDQIDSDDVHDDHFHDAQPEDHHGDNEYDEHAHMLHQMAQEEQWQPHEELKSVESEPANEAHDMQQDFEMAPEYEYVMNEQQADSEVNKCEPEDVHPVGDESGIEEEQEEVPQEQEPDSDDIA